MLGTLNNHIADLPSIVMEEAVLGDLNTYLSQAHHGMYANMKDGLSLGVLSEFSRQCAAGALALSQLKVLPHSKLHVIG